MDTLIHGSGPVNIIAIHGIQGTNRVWLPLATQLAGRHTHALGQIKRLMRSSFEHPLTEQLQQEYDAFVDCARQPAFTQAVEGFFTKRGAK